MLGTGARLTVGVGAPAGGTGEPGRLAGSSETPSALLSPSGAELHVECLAVTSHLPLRIAGSDTNPTHQTRSVPLSVSVQTSR